MRSNYLFVIVGCLLLSACSSSRYRISQDHAPSSIPELENVADAVPVAQPYSHYANKDYTVRGKRYQVWRGIDELTQAGKASWYGKKFHGHKTSNGEIYDMFSMSAAHKNLPLPSFVKVKNLANAKTVIVRVNDRGPFHAERIIDLSYAAAYKLDMLKSGTANVEIELIIPDSTESAEIAPEIQWFIQILASRNKAKTQQVAEQISSKYDVDNRLVANNGLYRLQVGPISDITKSQQLLLQLQQQYRSAYLFEELSTSSRLNK